MVEANLIINIVFGIIGNFVHNLDCFNRVLSDCGFTRKHNSRGAVINCVCNVRYFGSCRAWIFYHRLKHLGCRNNNLACLIHLLDNHFLDRRDLLERHLNAQVASCNHYSVGNIDYFINIIKTLTIFNLCNNFYSLPADSVKVISHNCYIGCASAKRSGNEIEVLFFAEIKVVHILF